MIRARSRHQVAAALLAVATISAAMFASRGGTPAHSASPSPSATASPSPSPTANASESPPEASPSSTASAGASPSPSSSPPSTGPLCHAIKVTVPTTLADLPVTPETVCGSLTPTLNTPAIDALQIYSVRRPDKLLVATLEVARLRSGVDPSAPGVASGIAGRVGNTAPEKIRVGHVTVYVSRATGVSLMTWFTGGEVFVLSVRDAFDHPRDILRGAVQAQ